MQKGRSGSSIMSMIVGFVVSIIGLVIVNNTIMNPAVQESLTASINGTSGSTSTMLTAVVQNIPILFGISMLMMAAMQLGGLSSVLGTDSSYGTRTRRYADDLEEIAENLGKRYYNDEGLPPLWIQMWQDRYEVRK